MYKYNFTKDSSIHIKTPKVNSMNDIKFSSTQTAECIKSRYEYPNGLITEYEQYCDKIIMFSNKRVILLENGELGFED